MSAGIEDRLRSMLRDRADAVRPSPPPVGLGHKASAAARRRLVLGAVASVVAVAAAVGAVALLREPRPNFIEPVRLPPKIFELSESVTPSPGRALVAVFPALGQGEEFAEIARTPHLQPVNGGPTVVLATTDLDPLPYSQHLSWDGTRVMRQYAPGEGNRLEIVNLETGEIDRLDGRTGFCPTLSPDNRTVAIEDSDGRISMVDARTGRLLRRGPRISEPCSGIGWSPNGQFLVIPVPKVVQPQSDTDVIAAGADSLLLDRQGRAVARLPGSVGVNASMSWAPDGHSLLLFNRASGRFVIRDVTTGSESTLAPVAEAARPMGWAGSRVVWLVGQSGELRLITTDRTGKDWRPWMRLDAGDRAIESVQWSLALSGRPEGSG